MKGINAMICKKCGQKYSEGSRFYENCVSSESQKMSIVISAQGVLQVVETEYSNCCLLMEAVSSITHLD